MHVKIYRMAQTTLPSHGQIFRDENAFDDFSATSEKGMNRSMQTIFSPSVPEGSVLLHLFNLIFRRLPVYAIPLDGSALEIKQLVGVAFKYFKQVIMVNAHYSGSVIVLPTISGYIERLIQINRIFRWMGICDI